MTEKRIARLEAQVQALRTSQQQTNKLLVEVLSCLYDFGAIPESATDDIRAYYSQLEALNNALSTIRPPSGEARS
ncbi:hypothetical protein ACQ4M4_12745 [Leptolyngbya sp. AN02str]|uniref:hypothetical protein n=1 Tax=Leptolyngbya sp. AN02str TaxID=3423363 RepID=UPI003D3177D9